MKAHFDELSIAMKAEGTEIRGEEWGEMAVNRVALPPGTDLGPMLQGLPDDLCQCPHWGQILEGSLHVRYTDGSEEVASAGEYYHLPPGHTVWTGTGVSFFEISPADELRVVMQHFEAKTAG